MARRTPDQTPSASPSLPQTVIVTNSLGIRRLHFTDELIQGVMKIDDPDRLLLDYAHKMMAWIWFGLNPRSVLLIGLGAGSIVRFILKNFPSTLVDVVEIDPRVIELCHEQFFVPRSDSRLRLHLADGLEFLPEAVRRGVRWDLILVDAYGETAEDPGFGTPKFLNTCAAALEEEGLMVINTIVNSPADRPNCGPLTEVFGTNVRYLTATPENNVIAVAGKSRSLHLTIKTPLAVTAELGLRTELWTFQ
jgi:spermidine synthase